MPKFLVIVALGLLLVGGSAILVAPTITQQIFSAILICSAFVLFGIAEISRLAGKAVASLERIEGHLIALDEHSADRMGPIRTAAERLNSLGR